LSQAATKRDNVTIPTIAMKRAVMADS
jgi:hypothetical protein